MPEVEKVSQFSLVTENNSNLTFKRVDFDIHSIELDKYIQIPTTGSLLDGLALKSAISSAAGAATQIGGVLAVNSNGLFSATVNPIFLTKFMDGTFSTMVHGSGGIVLNAGYQAASASVFAPLIVFQAMSIITGQYYLNGITKHLDGIDKEIKKLVALHHIERIAKIKHCVGFIQDLLKIEYPNTEDLVRLKMMESDIGSIHEEYAHYLSSLNVEELKASNGKLTSKKLAELYSKVRDASIEFNLKMAITTDEVLHLITIIEMIMNSRMSDNVENRAKRLGELFQTVKGWNCKNFYRERFGDSSLYNYYFYAITKALEILDNANLGTDKVMSLIYEFKESHARIKKIVDGENHVLEMGRKLINQMSEPVEILYLSNSENGDRVLMRKW